MSSNENRPRTQPRLVAELPSGPLDIIADVHGEHDALRRVLAKLGCYPERSVAERPIVFVGDLVDRGPDTPAVLRLVRQLCDDGIATMVLGNHEVNLLRGEPKEGNGWWFGHDDRARFDGERRAFPSVPVDDEERASFRDWMAAQPLVRQRDDLRIAHACWRRDLVARLPSGLGVTEAAEQFDEAIRADFERRGLLAAVREEKERYRDLKDIDTRPEERLPANEAYVVAEHADNPVRGITCGLEHAVPVADYEFIAGKYRTTARSAWWEDYDDDVPVVVGHYWRARSPAHGDKSELWSAIPPLNWAGPRGSVFCLDYSVGRRYLERWHGRGPDTGFRTGLAAMRWPERTLVFDDQAGTDPVGTVGFGGVRR